MTTRSSIWETTISTSPPSSASDEVARRLHAVRERIRRAGGDPARVRVLGVTKGFGPDAVRAAQGAGLGEVGENYAAELVTKAAELGGDPGVAWHFLGAIQRMRVVMSPRGRESRAIAVEPAAAVGQPEPLS